MLQIAAQRQESDMIHTRPANNPIVRSTTVFPRAISVVRRVDGAEGFLAGHPCVLRPGTGPAALVLDLGEHRVVRVTLRASGPGTILLRMGEDLTEALLVDDPYPIPNWYRLPGAAFAIGPDPVDLPCPVRLSGRYLALHAAAGGAPVTVHAISVCAETSAAAPSGRFSCSDPDLMRIYELCQRTLRDCSQRFLEDGPKRDGMLWIGDLRAALPALLAVQGDAALAAASLRMIAACANADGSLPAVAVRNGGHGADHGINYMPGIHAVGGWLDHWVLVPYVADFIIALDILYDWSGDEALLAELLPTAVRAADWLAGALDLPERRDHHGLWLTDVQRGQESWWHAPPADAAQVAWGLAAMQRLAHHARREPSALWQTTIDACAVRIRAAGEPPCDLPDGRPTWHVWALSCAAGLLSSAEAAAQAQALACAPDARSAESGYAAGVLHDAFWHAGLASEGLAAVRRWYAPMLAHDATTTWDIVPPDGGDIARPSTHAMSHCHAWSAGWAALAARQVLGVRAAAPGMRRVIIAPRPGGLAWISGCVPTPQGVITLSLECTADLCGEIHLPEGTEGELQVGDTVIGLRSGLNVVRVTQVLTRSDRQPTTRLA